MLNREQGQLYLFYIHKYTRSPDLIILYFIFRGYIKSKIYRGIYYVDDVEASTHGNAAYIETET
jgi:hypothetical protein